MSIIGSNVLAGASGSGVSAYEIEQSLRFDGSSYLTHTHGSTPTGDNGTLSVWVKRRGTNYDYDTIIEGLGSGNRRAHYLRGASNGTDGRIDMHQWFPDAGGIDGGQVPDAQLRDPSAWYHLLWQHQNSSTRSVSDRLWVNGVEQTDITTPGNHNAQPWEVTRNSATATIGRYGGGYGYLQGYIAEMHCIDGSLVDADEFGEYDDNGVWRPIEYDGTYGNNGFYLKFDPSATNGIGHDHSGNGNNFTANNFTTSGTGTDVMSDTPTTNYPTGNPHASNNPSSVSEGNLKFVGDTANIAANGMHTTMGMSSGKWYFEVDINVAGGSRTVGILPADAFAKSGKTTTTNYDTYYNDGALSFSGFSQKIEGHGSSVTINTYGNTWTTNDVIGVAFDADNGKLFFAKNNTWQESGDPAAGTNAAFTGISGTYVAHAGGAQGFTATFNFGQRDFTYTPPTGFKALNTSNLPAPDIADGSDYFQTVLWTGNGSYPRAVTGVGFSPDWVWLKSRSDGYGHGTYDRVRGVGTSATSLRIDSTSEEGGAPIGPYIDMDSLDSDGFTLGNTVSSAELFNLSTKNYVAWNWLAGGSGSSNTNGDINSTVSVSATSGFSIVSYEADGNNNTSVGHGLGVAPKIVIQKDRDSASSWLVSYNFVDGSNDYLLLDTNDGPAGAGLVSLTETTFGSWDRTSGNEMIAYCFAEVEGYSRIGSYVGNGDSTNGNFVYTGFKPAMVITKMASGQDNWNIYDSARNSYNFVSQVLYPDLANAEDTLTSSLDFLSNGFQPRPYANNSGATYIYMAFAEHPFGGSGVSPVTAR